MTEHSRKFNFDEWTVACSDGENIDLGCPDCGKLCIPDNQVAWPVAKVLREVAEKHWNEARSKDRRLVPKVYIFRNARLTSGDVHVFAAAEDGEVIAEHVCSSMSWAKHDLHDVVWKRSDYTRKFGGYGPEHYELVLVPENEDPPEGLIDKITAWIVADLKASDAELREKEAQRRDEERRKDFQ